MHQSFESLGNDQGIHLVCDWKQVNSRPHMSHTHDTPFKKKNRRTKNHVLQSSGIFWNDSINTSVCLAIFTTKLNRKLLKKSEENSGQDKTRLMNLLLLRSDRRERAAT